MHSYQALLSDDRIRRLHFRMRIRRYIRTDSFSWWSILSLLFGSWASRSETKMKRRRHGCSRVLIHQLDKSQQWNRRSKHGILSNLATSPGLYFGCSLSNSHSDAYPLESIQNLDSDAFGPSAMQRLTLVATTWSKSDNYFIDDGSSQKSLLAILLGESTLLQWKRNDVSAFYKM